MGFSFPALVLNSPIAIILRLLSERERIKVNIFPYFTVINQIFLWKVSADFQGKSTR